MKLTLLGGGGFRVPLMVRTLLKDSSEQRVRALTLWDSHHERLRTMERIVRAMVESVPHAPNVRVATDLRDAVRGADFVFSAIRVGGTDGRAEDERIAHACGVLGQETTGFGGLSYALRGIPVARAIAGLASGRAKGPARYSFWMSINTRQASPRRGGVRSIPASCIKVLADDMVQVSMKWVA